MTEPDILYVAKIVMSTSVDGPGLRNSLYVSGCPLRCDGCHNSSFWEIESGQRMTLHDVYNLLNEDDFNISILGGEPMMQYPAIVELCRMIKGNTDKTIWLWSGYTLEYIREHYPDILPLIDTLVDGPYIAALHHPNLPWRGSSNQRILPSPTFTPEYP